MHSVRSLGAPPHPFAPWLAPPERLERTLVGRRDALNDLLQKVQSMSKNGLAKHTLLIGPRGIGKTHLVCLLHHYVGGRLEPMTELPGVAGGWTCVLFVEEEYPTGDTLANFLLSLFRKLTETEREEESWKLPSSIEKQSDRAVIDCCLERIGKYAAGKKRKLLVVIDNIQKVLSQFPLEDQHRLRAFLMDQSAVLIVGTAPSIFNEIREHDAPFFEFFDTTHLRDLTEDEMLELIRARFLEDGLEQEFERRRDELARKMPAIRRLTGGNPRLALFLYNIVTRSAFVEVESALRQLIEELSDYFRGRYDSLAAQPRKVLDTLAQMEGPGTPTEIAARARLRVPVVNVQLKRLKEWGYVEPVKHRRSRETRYDVSERLFRIWRQTATVAGRQRFRFLAEFLKIYYTPDDMLAVVNSYRSRLSRGDLLPRDYVDVAENLYYFQEASSGALCREVFEVRVDALVKGRDLRGAEQETEYFFSHHNHAEDRAAAIRKRIDVLLETGRLEDVADSLTELLGSGSQEEVLAVADRILEREPGRSRIWAMKGDILSELGRHAEAFAATAKAVELDPEEPENWATRSWCAGMAGDYPTALSSAEKALTLDSESAYLWHLKALALGSLGEHSNALLAAEHTVELEPEDDHYWESHGTAAMQGGDFGKALGSYQRASALNPDKSRYWGLQADAMSMLGRSGEALTLLEEVLRRFPDDPTLWDLRATIARDLGQISKALESLEESTRLDPENAQYWHFRAEALEALGRDNDALDCIERALQLEPDDVHLALHRAQTLSATGQHDRALEALNKIEGCADVDEVFARAQILLRSRCFDEASKALRDSVPEGSDPWRLLTLFEIAEACRGKRGNGMEDLARSILDKGPTAADLHFITSKLFALASDLAREGDSRRARDLARAALSLPCQSTPWFGSLLGVFMRTLLDASPPAFEAVADDVLERGSHEVRELLNPYLQAVSYSRTSDVTILDRLFPEVRELVLEIVKQLEHGSSKSLTRPTFEEGLGRGEEGE